MPQYLPSTSVALRHDVSDPGGLAPFAFTAFGDSGYQANFQGNLTLTKNLGVPLAVHLGDMTYNSTLAAIDEFANRVKNTLGASFPFMLSAGNHEQCNADGHISLFTTRLPPQLPLADPAAVADPRLYALRYYFDYPTQDPYVRFIVCTPGEGNLYNCNGYAFDMDFSIGNANYNWLAAAIDDARARGYLWVIVCEHKNYISAGGKTDEVGEAFMGLCLEKKVDLILQGHEHNYMRSKGLGPPAVSNSLTIVEPGPNAFTKGRGTIIMVNGLGGTTNTDPFNTGDSDANFFAAWCGSNERNPPGNFSFGSAYFRVTPTRIDGGFRPITAGAYTEDYVIQ